LLKFIVESIQDLFYDGLTNPDEELQSLQQVLNTAKNRTILKRVFSSRQMDRSGFRLFVQQSCELDGDVIPSDELFSCATNTFADEDGDLPDKAMTKGEFAIAVVRLANLWVLMNEGMGESSKLSKQTAAFLNSLGGAGKPRSV
jgi:hypothetical protein